jgi:predicted nucleic-acid-binding Zn-ribbon protein
MGIIDETTYKLHCPKCGHSESLSILDKGSNFGGSCWQSGAVFTSFETNLTGGGVQAPQLTTAICKTCGTTAIIECF